MSNSTVHTDIAILGGGVAGLWLLNQMTTAGYQAVLLESSTLGDGQTIASQGMIHGGIKYALGGGLTDSSEAIAAMPERWRQALAGEGGVDLSGTRILSEHFYMWSPGDIGSRLGTLVASRALRGRVEAVSREAYPAVFDSPDFRGKLLRLVDLVVDVPSMLENLAQNCAGRIFSTGETTTRLRRDSDESTLVETSVGCIKARRTVLAAGLGNEALLADLDCAKPATQRRPLHQVLVRHEHHHELYGHCMGRNPSPRLTVSTHLTSDGGCVWYLGGDLATNHCELEPAALIAIAEQELEELFPWLDFGHQRWATLKIDRAEPRQPRLLKPDRAFAAPVSGHPDVIACWPTKLALAPNLATAVLDLLKADGVAPGDGDDLSTLAALGTPAVATPCWETLF